jgi:acyl carrier protein phosphodiesterase
MNYLGHAFLSFGDAEVLTGNMIADHVKGRIVLESYPPGIRKGILLHRKIDEFADRHPAGIRARLLFREDYGLYSGSIIDTLYDHFLAGDPKFFPDEQALYGFSQATYSLMQQHEAWMLGRFSPYFSSMREHNWLYNYRTVKGIERSLHGLARRAKYMPPIGKAYDIFITSYYCLNQCYYEFIDDAISFAKTESAALNF